MYNDDGSSIAENLFFWATRYQCNISAPAATASGRIHHGCFPLSSMMIDTTDTTQVANFTVEDLVRNSHFTQKVTPNTQFDLTNWMMNTNIPFSTYNAASTTFSNEF